MKKTVFKRLILFVFAVMFVVVSNVCVVAATANNNVVFPQNIAILITQTHISVETSNNYICKGQTTVSYGYIADITVELQMQEYSQWTTIEQWNNNAPTTAKVEELYELHSGCSYRLKCINRAYDSNDNLIEEIIKYSDVVTV